MKLEHPGSNSNMSVMWLKKVLLLVAVLPFSQAGRPYVTASEGQPWPRPQMMQPGEGFMVVRPQTFKFKVTGNDCDILQKAIKRYEGIMFAAPRAPKKEFHAQWSKGDNFRGYLDTISIRLMTKCEELPHPDMDEQYEIKIDSPDFPGTGSIIGQTIWGVLRGLETFSQLFIPIGDSFTVNSTQIMDFPRFSFRGLMIDTARHYLPLSKIEETLDLMAMSKFNVLHWHMVDDQSFPYVSKAFPNLSKLGSWTPSQIYTADNISDIIEYARLRGIRILPEFDTPGHTQSWGASQPGLLTTCYTNDTVNGNFGPIDPTNEANYEFLKEFFTEVTALFPDHYVHLGGDEVSFDCWKSNSNITTFMAEHNITGDYAKLEEYYITKLLEIVSNLPTKNDYFVWQEVFDNGVNIASDTVVHIWKNYKDPNVVKGELSRVTKAGYRTVISAPWYLNYIRYGIDWYKYYEYDPQDFDGSEEQKRLVMGGEACIWGEYVDATNLTPRLWPRASVVAEKLWSSAEHTNSTKEASPRLEEHRCRLLTRGYDAEPIWPSYCDVNYD